MPQRRPLLALPPVPELEGQPPLKVPRREAQELEAPRRQALPRAPEQLEQLLQPLLLVEQEHELARPIQEEVVYLLLLRVLLQVVLQLVLEQTCSLIHGYVEASPPKCHQPASCVLHGGTSRSSGGACRRSHCPWPCHRRGNHECRE